MGIKDKKLQTEELEQVTGGVYTPDHVKDVTPPKGVLDKTQKGLEVPPGIEDPTDKKQILK